MRLAEIIGLAVLVVVVVTIVVIAVRRTLLARAGGFDVSWRSRVSDGDRGWTLGQGRYRGRRLQLFRSFSPFPIPAMTLDRAQLVLAGERESVGAEPDLLPVGAVIVRCTHAGAPLELALSRDALTGLRSWVESRPPGSRLPQGGDGGEARSD